MDYAIVRADASYILANRHGMGDAEIEELLDAVDEVASYDEAVALAPEGLGFFIGRYYNNIS